MSENDSNRAVGFRLLSVRIVEFEEREVAGLDEFDLGVGFGLRLNEDQSQVQVRVTVQYLSADTDAEDASAAASLVLVATFELKDLDALRSGGGTVQVPQSVVASLVGIAYSTARGALIGRSTQHDLGEYPAPVISPISVVADIARDSEIPWIEAAPPTSADLTQD